MDVFPQMIIVFLLILLNGFFAASEYAIVAVRKTWIDELVKKGDTLARLVQKALENREEFISTTQIGTTVVSLILGWIGEPVFAKIFLTLFTFLPKGIALVVAHSLSIVFALLSLTFLSILLGELVPKIIALNRAELVSLTVITPISFFARVFRPFIRLLNIFANLSLKFLGFTAPRGEQLIYSKEELKMILDQIGQSGEIGKDEIAIIKNVFRIADKPINQLITARSEIVAYPADITLKKLIENIDESYSRFPVYKKSLDDTMGFIHVKDIYKLMIRDGGDKKLSQTNLIRKAISVPETKKADEVLLDMRKKHVHMAVVYDEFGLMVGIVTLEDIIESMIGDIQDEFDKPIKGIKRNSDGSYLLDGTVPLERFQKRFRLGIKGQNYTTVGGLVFGLLGREPRKGDNVSIGHFVFEIISVSGKRIQSLSMHRDLKKTRI
ncbi:HlyC/CorC family transporter [Candidatus Roizmanbacteria bacterium]|nr:HlyC/CorC family transporter [Candidatus Roizmanbacteria bacterium]